MKADQMISVIDNPDGIAQAEYELQLPDSVPVRLNDLIVYEGGTSSEVTRGLSVYTHNFTTEQPEMVDNVLREAMASANPRLRFRIGYGTPSNTSWLPWQDNIITHYSGILIGTGDSTGHRLSISTADMLYAVSRLTKTSVRKGTISGIVGKIAEENGMQAVLEKTEGEFSFVQSFTDDISFIMNRLQPRAVSTKGRGNYLFFIKDNVIHFHSPDYQTEIKDLYYFQTPHLTLAQVDASQQRWEDGGAGTLLIAYDPYTAESKELASNPDKALRLASSIYSLSDVPQGQINMSYTLSQNRPEEAVSIGQNTYEAARMKTFELVATFARLNTLRAGDIVRIVLSPTPSKSSPWSGYYLATSVVSTIDRGSITVTCQLNRGEIEQVRSRSETNSQGQLEDRSKAPGVDLNAREAQDSAQTVGAGKQTSTKVYTTVVDARNAP